MKNIKLISIILITLMSVCLTGCNKSNPWIPEVQGSYVSSEMPYEDIDGEYVVEKYTDFKSFKKSELADYNFISQRVAKEERYSAEFFKTRDLAVIKFNYPKSKMEFTVADVVENGSECVVKLLPTPNVLYAEAEDQETTYYCFIETQNDISDKTFRLEFLDEVIPDSLMINLSYITEENSSYLFDEDAPAAFKLSSPDAVTEFIEYDEILTEYNFVRTLLTNIFNNRADDKELLLIRTASSSFEELYGILDGGNVKIIGTKTNHYIFDWSKGSDESKLVAFWVPKGFVPDSIERLQYNEYEDEFTEDEKFIQSSYSLEKTTAITDNLTRFDFE